MNRNLTKLLITLAGLLMFMSCEKPTAFMESSEVPTDINITGLSYSEILNARAYSEITTDIPTVNSKGIPCEFEILSVRSTDSLLDESYLEKVSIASARLDTMKVIVDMVDTDVEKVDKNGNVVVDEEGNTVYIQDTTFHYTPIVNPNKAGQIFIEDGNMFSEGDYYFTLRLKPATDGDNSSNTKVFEDAFHLNVMPLLPISASYDPTQQNLVVGANSTTTAPVLKFVKPVPSYDVRYQLLGLEDTLVIDENSGQISLHPDYKITINETFSPNIKIISNITEEAVDIELDENDLLIVVSTEALELNVGPMLPTAVIYNPYGQNLVIGDATSKTTAADVSYGNPNVTFALGSHLDQLVIDAKTGEISLHPAYTQTEDLVTIMPTINVTSDISYQNRDFNMVIKLIISKVPHDVPASTLNFFYPKLAGFTGFSLVEVQRGGVGNGLFWKAINPKQLPKAAAAERPASVTGIKPLIIHDILYNPDRSTEHDSWMVMDTQNLTQYGKGFDISAVFWLKNLAMMYLEDGSKPADMEIYITSDYNGDVKTTNWTQVNDIVKFKIDGAGTEYTGTPYPGNQLGVDPDGLKDPSRNTYNTWLRFELDLGPYKDMSQFTLAFRYKTYFEGDFKEGLDGVKVSWGTSAGKFVVSDVNYKAVEQ
ncbi:hypothetical protein EI427_21510 [Flammeovirga pectinis]|uniref:DUF5017 domain-containing protein n=1 Tax=Flammeovirga pectinis TaxID=2494373 RepID=A0A3Q9FSC3_9BACT|nr:hypothetical protein [Flammeovirga pectinis]AZQ64805.1 hypothetical protein EI427_21510 [Flammeovirga pectinis]